MGDFSTYYIVISNHLGIEEENKLLNVLKMHKKALHWSINDIKVISPYLCMYKILMEDNLRPCTEHQHRLNDDIKEVVRAKVMKLLDMDTISPIFL